MNLKELILVCHFGTTGATAASKETKKEEAAAEAESEEDENPILYEQLKLAVEVSMEIFK